VLTLHVQFRILIMVLFQVVYTFAKLRLHYLGIDHNKVNHRKYLENGSVLETEVGDRFEHKQSFLLFVFGGHLFCELEGDTVPLVAHVVAVEHKQVSVFDVEFDVGDILHADQVFIGVVLHNVLALQTLVLFLQPFTQLLVLFLA